MDALLQTLGLSHTLLAQIFAGIATFLAVIAFLPAVGPAKVLKSRLLAVKDKREAMKARLKVDQKKKQKGQIDEGTMKVMRNTIEKFRMQDMLENTDLRMKLAQAGFRGPKAPIVFLFFRLVAPFLMGAAALFYFAVIYAGPFESGPELASEIALTNAELSYLGDRSAAYENFARRTGLQAVKSLTSALVQAERYGTPIASALRVLSEESRGERMSLAERKAASLPAKLTVPMIVFFLPVLFIVIIGPAAIQVMAG